MLKVMASNKKSKPKTTTKKAKTSEPSKEEAVNKSSTKNKVATNKKDKLYVKNKTNQKQVFIIDGTQVELKSYEKKEVSMDKKKAEKVYSYWITKNLIELVN